MPQYIFSCSNPLQHTLQIECKIQNINENTTFLQLPSWRPGRYEMMNFAKNIQRFEVFSNNGKALDFQKVTKDRWRVQTEGVSEIVVKYSYYAFQMDAGNSFVDESQVYINFVNCCIYAEKQINEKCEIQLILPKNYEIACGLTKKSNYELVADNFHQLADSPLIASLDLKHHQYEVKDTIFHIWIQGSWQPDWEMLASDFQKFTHAQIEMMEDFPTKEYHFLFQIVPYKFYHGVEHHNSTVIVFGPTEKINEEEFYHEFLSISSHELYHAWNICKIRPAEMMPYDYTKENYFTTGFVAEGITSYYGELFLVRAGVWKYQQYLKELNKVFKKHFDNYGRFEQSLVESSWDLWLDGYTAGIPNRKVSIYHKGAVVALILDLTIRKYTQSNASLDDVMRVLWTDFAKKQRGYTLQDFKIICEKVAGQSLQRFFDDCITGNAPLENILRELLDEFGFKLVSNYKSKGTELFGFQTIQQGTTSLVSMIAPLSQAAQKLSLQDEIIAIDGIKVENNIDLLLSNIEKTELTLFRQRKLKSVALEIEIEHSLKEYQIQLQSSLNKYQQENLERWLRSD